MPRPTLRMTSRGKLIGRNPKLVETIATADRIATSRCAVLVTGESGTGKEVVVAAIHDAGSRKGAPFVTVNCGAIPENLLESELFGHVRGAFTGAHANHEGLVAAAEGGTLFLDEIGELPLMLQVKLLRLIQQHEYSPVGDNKTRRCDIRIVAATNRDLEVELAAGRFREDLYFRLNVIHLHIPPLRERPEDIEALAVHFLGIAAGGSGRKDVTGFTAEALEAILRHDWPGNVRDLENAIERAVLMSPGGLLRVQDLPARIKPGKKGTITGGPALLPEDGFDLRTAVADFESHLICQALERTGWNKNRAAQLLGLNRTTLVEMVKRKGIRATGTTG